MTVYRQTPDVRDIIAPCYYDLHRDIKAGKYQYVNLPGGRGSAKSSFVSVEIPLGIMRDKTGCSNAIVFRLVGATLRESVYSQISWALDALGVSHLWKGTVSPMQHTYLPTGAQIIYKGLDSPLKLKSIKPKRGHFSFIWFEEFSELDSEMLLRSVQQSVIRGGNDFTVFRSFNPPISANNWANKYIQIPDSRGITLHTDYTMIPPEWLGDAFLYEAERLREVNPKAYEHEYMGVPTGTGGEVFPDITVRTITDDEIKGMQYFYSGVDFGFAVDPACFIRLSYDRKHETIYLLDEIYRRGISNRQLAEAIKEKGYTDTYIVCDCAEPKSIADLRDMGLPSRACYKRPGCVIDRVKWLQHRTIVIDPQRTPNAYREFIGYSYPVDKHGNLLSQLEDKDNHSVDGVGYALDQVIFRRGNVA